MNRTFFAVDRGPNPWPLDQYDRAKHHHFDPRKQTPGGRHQIGTPAGFKSESVAGFLLECVAGFVGIRTLRRRSAVVRVNPVITRVRKESVRRRFADLYVRAILSVPVLARHHDEHPVGDPDLHQS